MWVSKDNAKSLHTAVVPILVVSLLLLVSLLIAITVVTNLTEDKKDLERRVYKLSQDNGVLTTELRNAKTGLQQLQEENKQANDKLQQLQKDNSQLKNQVNQLQNQVQQLQKENGELKKKLNTERSKTSPLSSKGISKSGKSFYMNSSAYTAYCKGCSGKTTWKELNLRANPNLKVIAVDPNIIPLGTKVYVEGFGYAVAADTGGAIHGYKIDIFMPNVQQALRWGRRVVKVTIIN
jgi:3D (Asp-Asp-Asp) domain-containing protein/chaperonin cofactor prefoldin